MTRLSSALKFWSATTSSTISRSICLRRNAKPADSAPKHRLLMLRGMPWLSSAINSSAPRVNKAAPRYPATPNRCLTYCDTSSGPSGSSDVVTANSLPQLKHFRLDQCADQLRLTHKDDLH